VNRRRFLQILGLAPLAAKVAISDELLGNLSSAYDYRFGIMHPLQAAAYNELSAPAGIIGPTAQEIVALQLEHLSQQIPIILAADQKLWHFFRCEKTWDIAVSENASSLLTGEP
jgi:hypothetical protein